ncbi:hypothetical protein HanPI659440_Chr11g0433581 [Helianthus annuus]|nr:hypothetical protein HanPI659440_Chr11g0433581 [Helianthus annuus]
MGAGGVERRLWVEDGRVAVLAWVRGDGQRKVVVWCCVSWYEAVGVVMYRGQLQVADVEGGKWWCVLVVGGVSTVVAVW